MTATNFPAQNTDAPDAGEGAAAENTASPMDDLSASVADFESGQKAALETILGHASRLKDEFALLAARPTPEQLAEAEQTAADHAETITTVTGERDAATSDLSIRDGELAKARTRIAGLESEVTAAGKTAAEAAKNLETANSNSAQAAEDLAAAQGAIADRDRELAGLRAAAATDAATIKSFQDRFRSFKEATQSIMAGIAPGDVAPAAEAVPASTPAPATESAEAPVPDVEAVSVEAAAPEAEVPAIEAAAVEAEAVEAAAPPANVVPDPFDLGLDDEPAPAPVPAGIVLPDLDDLDEDPFESADSRARTALLATTVGLEDPFDVPEPAGNDSAGFSFVPAPVVDPAAETAAAPEPAVQNDQAQEPAEQTADAQGGAQPSAAPVDPLAFMDFDLGLDELDADVVPEKAIAGGVAAESAPGPKVVPVYI